MPVTVHEARQHGPAVQFEQRRLLALMFHLVGKVSDGKDPPILDRDGLDPRDVSSMVMTVPPL